MTARRKTTTKRKPKPGTAGPRSAGRLQRAIDDAVRREITAALEETAGNITHAARVLGVSRIALRARMNALGLGTPLRR
jgi:DNA-binding NtrC family response regulator